MMGWVSRLCRGVEWDGWIDGRSDGVMDGWIGVRMMDRLGEGCDG